MLTGLILTDRPNQNKGGKLKALLPTACGTLIQNQIQEMNTICNELIVVTQEPRSFYHILDLDVWIITDFYLGKGPLSSMHAGLSLAQNPDIWVVSTELPMLSAKAAMQLWQCKGHGIEAVIPIVGKLAHPLHGIYDRSCAAKAAVLLNKGESSANVLLKELRWHEFHMKEDIQ